MGDVTPGLLVLIIIAFFVVEYFVVRAASSAAIDRSREGKGLRNRAEGLYIDNLGLIMKGLGVFSPRSDAEKERLRELKRDTESLGVSERDPEWVVTELERINDELRSL